ncbi:MAG: DUF4340 domain-containing protein, partial [Ruthenibacterium sp.]
MTKQKALLLTLGIGIVVFAVTAMFLLGGEKPQEGELSEQAVPVTDIKVNAVSALALKNKKGSIGIINENGSLQVLNEDTSTYDADKLAALLYNFAHLNAEKVLKEPLDLQEYGLDEPAAQVSLILADGTKQRLFLGSQSPVSDAYYLQKEGDNKVYLVSSLSAMMLLQASEDLRMLNLYPPLNEAQLQTLNTITLETPNGGFTLKKLKEQAGDLYEMTAPVSATLDWKKVDSHVIIPLQQLVPQQFVSTDVPLQEYGLDA